MPETKMPEIKFSETKISEVSETKMPEAKTPEAKAPKESKKLETGSWVVTYKEKQKVRDPLTNQLVDIGHAAKTTKSNAMTLESALRIVIRNTKNLETTEITISNGSEVVNAANLF